MARDQEKVKAYNKFYYYKHKTYENERSKQYLIENKERYNEKYRIDRSTSKVQVLAYYSIYKIAPMCSVSGCLVSDLDMLTLDHINDDGGIDRKKIGSGYHLYKWLIENNFPVGYQTMCINHNIKKEINRLNNKIDKGRYYIQNKRYQQKLKYKVLSYYSIFPATPMCIVPGCVISDIDMLCIDHINGNGNNHRKAVGSGSRMYRWLVRSDFPEGYLTFCWNHNTKKELGL